MCQFQHACFISYRHHPQSEIAERFIEDLCTGLRNELAIQVKEDIYVDRERMKGGDFFNAELASALCRSVCMIVIYTPQYFSREHPYCAREFLGMEQIEQRRYAAMPDNKKDKQRGLIIPVVLRGADRIPAYIKDRRHFYSFENFSLVSRKLSRNPQTEKIVRDISKAVIGCREALAECGPDALEMCKDFEFPSNDKVEHLLSVVASAPQQFPLRPA